MLRGLSSIFASGAFSFAKPTFHGKAYPFMGRLAGTSEGLRE